MKAWLVIAALCACERAGSTPNDRAPSSPDPVLEARAPVGPGKLAGREGFGWLTDEAAAFAKARAEDKAVVVAVCAEWAVPCVELRQLLDARDTVDLLAPKFIGLRVDLTEDLDGKRATAARYDADTIPHVVFVAPDGTLLARIQQLPSREQLHATIDHVARKL